MLAGSGPKINITDPNPYQLQQEIRIVSMLFVTKRVLLIFSAFDLKLDPSRGTDPDLDISRGRELDLDPP